MKITITEKFKQKVKDGFQKTKTIAGKGISIIVVAATIITSPSCANNKKNANQWDYTITTLKESNNFLGIDDFENYNENITHNYEVGLFINKEDGFYYQILDSSGNIYDNIKYYSSITINDHTRILKQRIKKGNNVCVLLNLNTGEKTSLPCDSYYSLNNSKYFFEISSTILLSADAESTYEEYRKSLSALRLYNEDGSLARKNYYRYITVDNNKLFLSSDDYNGSDNFSTEVIDLKTNKSAILDKILVTEAKDNYFIAKTEISNYNECVYYLENINDYPKLMMPNTFNHLLFLDGNNSPTFITKNDEGQSINALSITQISDKFNNLDIIPAISTDKKIKEKNYAVAKEENKLTILNNRGKMLYENLEFDHPIIGGKVIIDDFLLLAAYQKENIKSFPNISSSETHYAIYNLKTKEQIIKDLIDIYAYYDNDNNLKIFAVQPDYNYTIYDAKTLVEANKGLLNILTKKSK